MLGRSNNILALNSLDSLRRSNSLKHRIASKALPVPSASRHTSKRAHAWSQDSVNSLQSSLPRMQLAPLVQQLAVPGCACGEPCRPGGRVVAESDAERSI